MFSRLFEWVAWLHGNGKTADQVCREWHSLLIGYAEMVCLSIPARFAPTTHAHFEMKEEYHYFAVGRALGVLTWVLILVSIWT